MTSQRTSGDPPVERGSLPLDIDDVHILLQGQMEALIEHTTKIKPYYLLGLLTLYVLQCNFDRTLEDYMNLFVQTVGLLKSRLN